MKSVLLVLVVLAVIISVVRVILFFRSRAMRALASRWGFQYIRRNLPPSFSLSCYPADCIRQAWNVIAGEHGGMSILIFDSVVGEGKGAYCTFIASQTEQNHFGTDTSPDHLVQSAEWVALYRLRFLQIPWTMGIQRIEGHLKNLAV